MRKENSVTKDDVARLTRGKPSRSRCGSRQIRHRLRLDELERLAVARSRGYLLINSSTRTALKNAWYLDRCATALPCIYAERTPAGFRLSGSHNGNAIQREVSYEQFNKLALNDVRILLR
jgi:hypothetical protein